MRRTAMLLAGIVVNTSSLGAQVVSTVVGRVVRAGSNVGIGAAEVALLPRGTRAVTDSLGEFRLEGVPAGFVTLHVRRLGFAPESLGVTLPLSAPIDIELRETAQPLDTVSVRGPADPLLTGKLAGFYERKKFGIGRFLEAQDIERFLTRRLADIIVARMPGTTAVRSAKGGLAAYIATVRMMPRALVGTTSTGQGAIPGSAISARGPRATTCYPDVYLDGVVVYSSGSEEQMGDVRFDVNSIDPGIVSAIEFYSGPAQMPAQFNRTGSACGALLIWTK
jgi:hypothetical protein